jgi:hypothetical protein
MKYPNSMANASANTSSGPVLRRNFTASSQKRPKNGSIIRIFFFALIALVVALSALAVHLSQRVMTRQSSSSSLEHPPHAHTSPSTATAAVVTKDRVYCMVPFIWNPDIYHVIMDTWGKRCDTINFLTDSIVGGQLQGDKILDNPNHSMAGYKPYYDYPTGTFPNNVVFINMTRSWFDCGKDSGDNGRGGGEKKVCRHIWEKM